MRMNSKIAPVALAVLSLISVDALQAQVITKKVVIRPILIQGTSTGGGATGFAFLSNFIAAADKIWGQAGIDIQTTTSKTITMETFKNVSTSSSAANYIDLIDSAYTDFGTPNNGISVAEALADQKILNVFFIGTINGSSSIAGTALENGPGQSANGIYIANVAATSGGGALGALAHEIGHSLGLSHDSALGSTSNLMEGSSAIHTSNMSDIFPDGLDKYQLNAAQKTTVSSSFFLQNYTPVPEPEETSAVVAGVLAVGYFFWRRRQSRQQA